MIDSKVSDPKVRPTPTDTKAALPPQRTEARQAQTVQGSPSGAASAAGAEPTTEEIAALAYQLWIERGSPHGSHDEDWYRAEEQLRCRQPLSKAASV